MLRPRAGRSDGALLERVGAVPRVEQPRHSTAPARVVDPSYDPACMQADPAVTGDPDADQLLNTDPLALLIGMQLTSRCSDEEKPQRPYASGCGISTRSRSSTPP